MKIGDSVIMFAEEWPEGGRFSAETWGHSPVTMNIQVPDVDAFVEHAVAAGAKLVSKPNDQF
jgi:PhnB protein